VLPVYFKAFQAVLLGHLSNLRTRKPGSAGSPDPLRAPFRFLMQLTRRLPELPVSTIDVDILARTQHRCHR
jgi:hypothetical protein